MTEFVLYHTSSPTESEAFIRLAAADYLGRPHLNDEIIRSSLGKPSFRDPTLPFFSLSHSATYTICAVGSHPCGVDIQVHRFKGKPRSDGEILRIARRFFHPAEAEFLENKDADALSSLFFDIWTAKESYVKFTGRGIAQFPTFHIMDPASLRPFIIKKIPFAEEVSLFLTAKGDFTIKLKNIDKLN